ncbi:MAG: 50S ribosomal protein L20 [Candidatus Paceibacterota bacterium]
MARVKRGTTKLKTRKNILSKVKGYRFGRSKKEREARTAIAHAGNFAFAHRRDKKNVFRRLWSVRLNAAVRPHGLSYSQFIHKLKEKNVGLDRKVLSEMAQENPESFERVIKHIS